MTKTKEACRCKKDGCCKSKRALYKVHCNNCGMYLCDAPASTWTRCGSCRRWSRVEPEAPK